jgi:hypothetical protein
LKLSGGGSAIAVCESAGLNLTEYPLSDSCTGPSVPDLMPINQCLQDEQGTYFENICSNQSPLLGKALKITSRVAKKLQAFKNARA